MNSKLSFGIMICLLIIVAAVAGRLGEEYDISILSLIGIGIGVALCCLVIVGFFYGAYQAIKELVQSYKRKHNKKK